MNKIWKPSEPKSDKLIIIQENCIYKGNPKPEELIKVNEQTTEVGSLSGMFSIPYSYIKKVINQQGKDQIKIYFGSDSEEEIHLKSERQKNEIFDFLKSDIPNLRFRTETPNAFKYAKPQFFAIIILTGIFIWAMYFAVQLANGYEYELVGGKGGIIGVILLLAHLGMTKLIVIYSVLIGIAGFSLLQRLKSRSQMQILSR